MSFIGKTSTFLGLEALRNLVSDSMAIDMGSASTIIAVRGRGVVVDEPSVVAVSKTTGEIVAIGREAQTMQGREARDVTLVKPMVDGVVADFERSQRMLDHFVRAARIGRVYMVEEGLAAAIGAGVSVDEQRASAVVDIGGATTNVAVIALGMIVYAQAERVGSSDIDVAIMDRLRRHHGLIIGAPTAERLKIELASAIEPKDAARTLTVKGRDVQSGTPRAAEVTSDEVCGATQGVVQRIARVVQRGVAELSPEVAADIYDRGLILTGGGALLEGMAAFLQSETRLSTHMAEDPRHAIVKGLSQLFDDPLLLRRVTRNEPSLLLDADAGAFETYE